MSDWVGRLRHRLRAAGLDTDVVEEVVDHARELYRAARAGGTSHEDAVESLEAELRDLPALVRGAREHATGRLPPAPEPPVRRPHVVSTFAGDAVHGIWVLAARPGFAVLAILTLALGIGANTALFSVVNSVLLAPLPFPEPDRLVNLWEADANDPSNVFIVSQPNYDDWLEQATSFAATAIWEDLRFNIAGDPEPEQVPGLRVSSSAFAMLGLAPQLGRTFTAEEDAPGHDVVVISDALWKRRFGASPSIVGRTIRMNGRPFEVIGVMPPAFCFTQKPHAVWVPIQFNEQDRNRGSHSFFAAARLKPGVDIETARAEMATIGARLAKQYEENRGETATLTPMGEWGVRYLRGTLLMLQGAVALVLLIGCVNVANLLLAQAGARRREFAIRVALGAGASRIVWQLLAEGMVLAAAGAAAGVSLAWVAVRWLAASFPPSIRLVPFRDTADAAIDLRVLGFAVLAAAVTGIVFSVAPVLAALKTPPSATLRGAAGRSATAAGGAFRAALMAVEVALAVVVLAGAGLMLKSMWRLTAVDPGLDPTDVLTMQLALPQEDFYGPAERATFCDDLTREIGSLAGVEVAGATSHLPLSGANAGRTITIEGRPAPAPGEAAGAAYRVTCPGLFKSLGIPLKRGRDFTSRDTRDSEPAAIINETTASRYWPGEDPVGKRFKVGDDDSGHPWLTVVGVVGNVRHFGLDDQPRREFYRPYPQAAWPVMTVTVRTAGEPIAMTGPVRAAVRRIDPDQAVTSVRSMEDVLETSMEFRSFPTMLLGIFAAVALTLSAVGVYGVVGYLVSQRTKEIGIRIALGARRTQVIRLVVGGSLLPIAIGLGAGIAGALVSGRLLTALLFDVQPTDPGVLLAIVLVLGAVGTIGSWLPARRAASVDPLVVLRNE